MLQSKYRDCILEWRRLVRAKQIADEERIISADSVGAFYQFVNKSLLGTPKFVTANRSSIGVIHDDSGSLLTNSLDKANAFNKYFSSVGVADNSIVPSCHNIQLNNTLETMVISETDVIRSITSLKNSGPDSLPPVVFKRLKCVLCVTILFNQLLSVGGMPTSSKGAFIVPVYKKGIASN